MLLLLHNSNFSYTLSYAPSIPSLRCIWNNKPSWSYSNMLAGYLFIKSDVSFLSCLMSFCSIDYLSWWMFWGYVELYFLNVALETSLNLIFKFQISVEQWLLSVAKSNKISIKENIRKFLINTFMCVFLFCFASSAIVNYN